MAKHKQTDKKDLKLKDLKLNLYYPLGLALLTVLLLTLFSLFYDYPGVGEAIRVSPEEPLDLTTQGEYVIDVGKVSQFEIAVEASADGYSVFDVVIAVSDDTARYELSEFGHIVASGYLGNTVSHTEGIYVDDDAIADVRFSYNSISKMFSVSSPLYIAPSSSTIELVDEEGNAVESPKIVLIGEDYQYFLRVSSSSSPNVAVYFSDDLPLTLEETTIGGSSASSARTFEVMFSPTQAKPYELIVESEVGGELSLRRYVFGGDGVVYQLSEEGYPSMKVTLIDDLTQDAEAELSFFNSGKQPFSLPCTGSVIVEKVRDSVAPVDNPMTLLEMVSRSDFSSVYGYSVQRSIPAQYVKGVPSDFYYLDALKGYLLEVDDQVTLTSRCRLSSDLPSLQRGWNLVGVTGLKEYDVSVLDGQIAPGLRVQEIYEVGLDETYVPLPDDQLLPGKAYWVLVV